MILFIKHNKIDIPYLVDSRIYFALLYIFLPTLFYVVNNLNVSSNSINFFGIWNYTDFLSERGKNSRILFIKLRILKLINIMKKMTP